MNDSLIKEPAVNPFVECPNCKELLEWEAKLCPRCREEIDPEYATISAVLVYYNTQACSLANSISTFDAFIPLALILGVGIFLIDWYSGTLRISFGVVFWPIIPLLIITLWFIRFGRFNLGDEEYLKARREMKHSFAFWLALLIVQLLLILVLLRT